MESPSVKTFVQLQFLRNIFYSDSWVSEALMTLWLELVSFLGGITTSQKDVDIMSRPLNSMQDVYGADARKRFAPMQDEFSA